MTKLTLIASLALSLLAASLPGCSAGTAEGSSPPAAGAAARVDVVTSDAAGFDTHSWYLDTGKEVVVFDAQFTPAQARQVIASIKAKTTSPIRWLVVTHPNPDKFNGAPAFQELGARVVASEATAAAIPAVHAYKKAYFVGAGMFTADSYPAEARVDVTFRGQLSLPLEAGEVTLRELQHPGVSTTQTIAVAPGHLFVGDLVHHRAHAWLEGGIRGGHPAPDLASWSAALDELRPFDGATVHGGRGDSAPVVEAVTAQQGYLRDLDALVKAYVAALPDRAVLQGKDAGAHWKAIRQQAEKKYPDHALSYLIEYGVYGLALSR